MSDDLEWKLARRVVAFSGSHGAGLRLTRFTFFLTVFICYCNFVVAVQAALRPQALCVFCFNESFLKGKIFFGKKMRFF